MWVVLYPVRPCPCLPMCELYKYFKCQTQVRTQPASHPSGMRCTSSGNIRFSSEASLFKGWMTVGACGGGLGAFGVRFRREPPPPPRPAVLRGISRGGGVTWGWNFYL